MTSIGQPERATQNRMVALFRDELDWRYLGDWSDREGNANVEESLFTLWLHQRTEAGKALMQTFLPEWEDRRRELNRLPVRHEDWDY